MLHSPFLPPVTEVTERVVPGTGVALSRTGTQTLPSTLLIVMASSSTKGNPTVISTSASSHCGGSCSSQAV